MTDIETALEQLREHLGRRLTDLSELHTLDRPVRAVVYTRPVDARQRLQCEAYAEAQGWETVGLEYDLGGASKPAWKREGWRRAVAMVEDGRADVVVVVSIDRITRTPADDMDRLLTSDIRIAVAGLPPAERRGMVDASA